MDPASRIREERTGLGVRLTWRWFSGTAYGVIVFAAVWDIVLICWYAYAFAAGLPAKALLFPLIHTAVGIGFTYGALTLRFNQTTIETDAVRLVVRHGPIPWRGNRDIPRHEIQTLSTRQVEHNSKGGKYHTYSLDARLRDGKSLELVSGLQTNQEAEFIKERLKENLG